MALYRRPKFLEILHEIREEMSREVDYDVDLFAETIRTGKNKRKNQEGKKDYSETEPLVFDKLAEGN